jgi:hypothetical protein
MNQPGKRKWSLWRAGSNLSLMDPCRLGVLAFDGPFCV